MKLINKMKLVIVAFIFLFEFYKCVLRKKTGFGNQDKAALRCSVDIHNHFTHNKVPYPNHFFGQALSSLDGTQKTAALNACKNCMFFIKPTDQDSADPCSSNIIVDGIAYEASGMKLRVGGSGNKYCAVLRNGQITWTYHGGQTQDTCNSSWGSL